jgi:hypothetical protein
MCDNKVSYYVSLHYQPDWWKNDYKEVFVKCGDTNPFGGQALCNKCIDDPAIKQQQENADADNAWLKSAGWGEM